MCVWTRVATRRDSHDLRDTAVVHAFVGEHNVVRVPPPLDLKEMLLALKDVLGRADLFTHHAIQREPLSVRQRMGDLLESLGRGGFHRFETLFDVTEGRLGVVVTFLAMLELAKEMLVEIVQEEALGPIYLKTKVLSDAEPEEALA